MNSPYKQDRRRGGSMPLFQFWLRKEQSAPHLLKYVYKPMGRFTQFIYKCEISPEAKIDGGLYIGHPYCITINPNAKIGRNCNIHKGVTIGQENRGKRKGAPIIGNEVWIGVNSTIVSSITIGDDVLIAPNSYVNQDIPSHSVVFGNPCQIRSSQNATEGYINRKI
jgi:serine O-acetyltransferase